MEEKGGKRGAAQNKPSFLTGSQNNLQPPLAWSPHSWGPGVPAVSRAAGVALSLSVWQTGGHTPSNFVWRKATPTYTQPPHTHTHTALLRDLLLPLRYYFSSAGIRISISTLFREKYEDAAALHSYVISEHFILKTWAHSCSSLHSASVSPSPGYGNRQQLFVSV